MKETNLTPSPRLKGRCCLTDFLYSKTTLLLLIFMLPMAIFSQEFGSEEYMKKKEANHQEWLRTQRGASQNSEILQNVEISEYQAMLEKFNIDEQKAFDKGLTKADIQAEINRLLADNIRPTTKGVSSGEYARSGGADACADAVVLSCDEPASGDTYSASTAGFISCSGFSTSGSVWYKITGNGAMNTVTVTTSNYSAQLRVYSSNNGDCSAIQCAGGTSGQGTGTVSFLAAFDEIYYVNVAGLGSQEGTYTILRTSAGECNDTPPGDGLAPTSAFPIACGDIAIGDSTGFPLANTTEHLTASACTPLFTSDLTSPAVWYTFTAVAGTPEDITFTTCGYDTSLVVYSGTPGSLTCVGGSGDATTDDFCGAGVSFESEVSFTAELDETYYIKLWGYDSDEYGPYQLRMVCDGDVVVPPPSAPNNDLCPDAIEITCTGSDYTIQGTTIAATSEGEPPACDDTWSGVGVWYYIDGDGSTYELITCGYDTVISVYEAVNNQCGAFNCVTSDDIGNTAPDCTSAAIVTFGTVEDQRYYIYVSSWSASTEANFDLRVSCIPPPEPPANDDCANAESITCDGFASGNTALATSDDIPSCGDNTETTASGVWYSFTPAEGEDWITASSIGLTMETIVNVYTGGCNGLECVGGDNGTGDDSEVTWLAQSGTEYLIFVAGDDATTGAFELELTCTPDPCLSAPLISCADGQVFGSTSGASGFPIEQPACGSGGNQPGFMYELVGEGKFVDINTCGSNYDTNLNVYTGSCGNLQCVTGNDDWSESSAQCGALFRSRVGFFANEGQSYYIWVNGYNSGFGSTATGDFTLNISCEDPEPNDLCEDALRVSCGASIEGSTALSTGRDKPEDDCSGSDASEQGVWYIVTGTGGDIELSLCETTYDAKLLVFEGECGDLTCVAGNNDGSACGVSNQPFVSLPTEYGQDYYVYVTGYNTNLGGTRVGDFTLNVDCLCTPGELEECVTLYQGYEDSVTLAAELQLADGAVSYLWSNGATTQSIEVSVEDANLNYSVTMTDESGCGATKTFFVYVVDVDCDRNNNSDKVELCHNGQSICVNWEAVDSHLAHGDSLGVCGTDTCGDAVPSCDSLLTSNTVDVDINPTITWNAPSAGFVDYYVLSVGTTSGGTDIVDNENVGEVFSYSLSNLAYETTYYVSIVPYNGNGPANSGCSESTFTTMEDPTPVNDTIAGAIAVNCGDVVTGSTEYATQADQITTFCGTSSGAPGVWFTFVSPDGYDVTASLCGSTFDTKVQIYESDFTCVGGNDDNYSACGDPDLNQSSYTFTPVAGETYYIYVYGWNTSIGDYELAITCEEPPAPCTDPNVFVSVNTDDWPGETSWELRDATTGNVLAEGDDFASDFTNYTTGLCLPDACYEFEIFDAFGDGICCGEGNGSYSVTTASGDVIASGGDFDFSEQTDFCLPFTGGPSGSYCDSEFTSGCCEWITGFELNTINNPSGFEGYGDFTALSTDLTAGATYSFTINAEVDSNEGYAIWIDYNQDFDFDDAGEQVFLQGTTNNTTITGSFTVPATALSGSTRLRVMQDWQGIVEPCIVTSWGETEDYTVNIVSGARPEGNIKSSTPVDWSMAPNPTRGNVTLDLTNYLQSDVSIEVMNVTGKVIYNSALKNLKGAKHDVELNSSLPAGMYFVRVAANGEVSTKKLMIMR